MRKSIAICGHSLTVGGLQRVTGIASLALAELGYNPVLILRMTKPVDFAYAGRLLPADLSLPEIHAALARACLILDYNWNDFVPGEPRAALHDYLTEHHADRLAPTAHNTFTVEKYLDFYREKGLLHRLPAIICVSKAVRAAAEARYGSLPNAHVLYNAICPEFIKQSHTVGSSPHPRPYFLFAGRNENVEHKGLDYLIEAWKISGLGDTHDLVLLGDQKFAPALMTLIERENVSSSVVHQPFTTNPHPWMRHAEAMVLASRHEGLGLVLPEALALGTPCIATRCGGPEEVIQDGVNGLMLDVSDTQGFANAMVRMAREPGLRDRLAANAPASAEPFTFPAHVRAWKQLLTELKIHKKTIIGSLTAEEYKNRPPAVSVQLPIFNKARYLRDCLDSIAAQTMTDFEVICVDDGSTDGSWEIAQEYAKRDPRFRLFRHQTNLGTMATRKRCFQEARGGYMAFADADDTAYPEWLAKLLETAQREKADIVQCAADVNDDEKYLTDEVHKQYQKSFTITEPTMLEGGDVFKGCGWPIKTNLWLSLVSRPVYRAILPYIPDEPVQHGNDGILIFMMTFFADKYVSIPDRLYCYRANDTSSNLVIPNPKTTLGHIHSRANIVRIAKNFLSKAAPGCNMKVTPTARFEQSCKLYTQALIKRCVEKYPEEKETLERAFTQHFADFQAPAPQTAAAGTPPPSFVASAPTARQQPFLKRFRKMAVQTWVSPKIQRGGLFFADWYLERYPDVKAAGVDPLKHFLIHGGREGRNPNPLFDTKWYLSVNPDVASSGVNPLVHYLRHGWREGRSPSLQFNITEYLRRRPDVAKAGVEPLGHYLLHGVAEGVLFPTPQLPYQAAKQPTAKPAAPQTPVIAKPPVAATLRQQPKLPQPPLQTASSLAIVPPVPRVQPTSVAEKPEPARPAESGNHIAPIAIAKPNMPLLKLSTTQELKDWYTQYPDFIALREKARGKSEKDYLNADLKLIQDLAIVDFMTKHLRPGAKILEIGGGVSRVLTYFKDKYECWNVDKFEGIGNGPKFKLDYINKLDYIGAFSKDLPSGYFDCVFSISVFEHIQGDAAKLNAITDDIDRLLKHNGVQVHCMDCRFPPSGSRDLPKQRPLINHVIERHGFNAQYVYDHYQDPEVFTMSGQAYDRSWKAACGNRPHELDGLPFNIFLAAERAPQRPTSKTLQPTSKTPEPIPVAQATPPPPRRHKRTPLQHLRLTHIQTSMGGQNE